MIRFFFSVLFLFLIPAVLFSFDSDCDELDIRLFRLVNDERKDAGLEELDYYLQLEEVAKNHLTNMIENSYFSHIDSNGRNVNERVNELFPELIGYFSENMAGITALSAKICATKTLELWMESEKHRNNILSENYNVGGIASHYLEDKYYIVMIFGELAGEITSDMDIITSGTNIEFQVITYSDYPKQQLLIYVYYPDKESFHSAYDGYYYQGMECINPTWTFDGFRFNIETVWGLGEYILRFSANDLLYPVSYTFQVSNSN